MFFMLARTHTRMYVNAAKGMRTPRMHLSLDASAACSRSYTSSAHDIEHMKYVYIYIFISDLYIYMRYIYI